MPRKKKPTHGGVRDGAGRPPKAGEARSVPIPVKLSPTELDTLRARAEREELSLAALVRRALGFE